MIKKFVFISVLILSLFCITGCSNEEKEKVIYTVELENETVELTFDELKDIEESNKINWENNYMNKKVSFTDKVVRIDSYNGDAHIVFEDGMIGEVGQDTNFFLEVESIKVGDTLTCSGSLPSSLSFWIFNFRCS